MNVLSLFAGIGGIDLGLERAGMTTIGQIEWDDYCVKVLEKHWPDVPRWRDVNTVTQEWLDTLGQIDLIAGGFPCQPVSLAGKREAQNDERWLWPAFHRIIRMVRPRYVVVENVPGLASAGMGDVLGDLAKSGFDAEWQSIPAAAVGAPHLRWRIFIVAYPSRERTGVRPVFPEPGGQTRGTIVGSDASPVRLANGPVDAKGVEPSNPHVADSQTSRRNGRGALPGLLPPITGPAGRSGEQRRARQERETAWTVEPDVGRVAHGIPHRMDRLRALGNAVVPQVAETVGQMIMAATADA